MRAHAYAYVPFHNEVLKLFHRSWDHKSTISHGFYMQGMEKRFQFQESESIIPHCSYIQGEKKRVQFQEITCSRSFLENRWHRISNAVRCYLWSNITGYMRRKKNHVWL